MAVSISYRIRVLVHAWKTNRQDQSAGEMYHTRPQPAVSPFFAIKLTVVQIHLANFQSTVVIPKIDPANVYCKLYTFASVPNETPINLHYFRSAELIHL